MEREVGHYNVNLDISGNLDCTENRWYYLVIITKFDDYDRFMEKKTFYIKGHERGNTAEKAILTARALNWVHNVNEETLDFMFKNRNFMRFLI